MSKNALGMIETYGSTAAIEAIDTAVKSAGVSVLSKVMVGGGLVAVLFRGDVGSVSVAVKAGVYAAQRVGEVISSHVIARVHDDTEKILPSGIAAPGLKKDAKNTGSYLAESSSVKIKDEANPIYQEESKVSVKENGKNVKAKTEEGVMEAILKDETKSDEKKQNSDVKTGKPQDASEKPSSNSSGGKKKKKKK